MTAELQPPREPEIEALGRVARRALWLIRRVLWIAGAVAVGYGLWRGWTRGDLTGAVPQPSASGVVWLCVGLPLLARIGWLFGRGRWLALGVGGLLWFGASLLPDDPDYGYVLRFFASLIACLTLLVWRTLWSLTAGATGAAPASRPPA